MIYAGYTPKKSSDEQYTPAYAVAPIIKYIPGNKIVWCPFDTEHSEYVLALKAAGIRVVHSHILTGEDFFVYEPEEWDLIVSNPPFSIKQKVVERTRQAVCVTAFQSLAEQQCTGSLVPRKGDADVVVRQTYPVYGKERCLFRIKLLLLGSPPKTDCV